MRKKKNVFVYGSNKVITYKKAISANKASIASLALQLLFLTDLHTVVNRGDNTYTTINTKRTTVKANIVIVR